jgi:predicted nucleic acid-binding protein
VTAPEVYAAVDTDVASLLLKDRLPANLASELSRYQICTTAIMFGELTQWAELRSWGVQRRARLFRWLASLVVLPCDQQVARTWGAISAAAIHCG